MNNIEKDIFNMFMKCGDDKFQLSKDIIVYIEKVIKSTKKAKNNEIIDTLISLHDSINNAGCEKRRSNQLDTIRNAMRKIDDEELENN